MVVADSGVWIDYFGGEASSASERLDGLMVDGSTRIVVLDLILFEVLRGFRHERDFRDARVLMQSFGVEDTGGAEIALAAAQNDRQLRAAGFTVRNGIDVLIATFCIERGYTLLHRDRDFEAFEALRGLRGLQH